MSIIVQSGKTLEQVFEFINKTSDEQVVIEIEKQAKFKGIVLISKMNSCNISFEIQVHEGGEFDLYGLVIGQNNEKGNFNVSIIHLEPNTKSNIRVKAVIDNQSKLNFTGLIKVKKSAQKTQSYLREDVLLLANNIQTLSKPQLEIEANDVKVSHGTTIGRINQEQLFYLTSRGISKEQGKMIITKGFVNAIIEQISNIELKNKFKNNLYVD